MDAGMRGFDRRHALGRGDDADEPDVAGAGVCSTEMAAMALPPVASIGSTTSAVLSRDRAAV
jgi:hypothetical protein